MNSRKREGYFIILWRHTRSQNITSWRAEQLVYFLELNLVAKKTASLLNAKLFTTSLFAFLSDMTFNCGQCYRGYGLPFRVRIYLIFSHIAPDIFTAEWITQPNNQNQDVLTLEDPRAVIFSRSNWLGRGWEDLRHPLYVHFLLVL